MGNYTFENLLLSFQLNQHLYQPVQLMMTPYMPYADEDKIVIAQDKVVTVKPKKEILALRIKKYE